MTAGTGEGSDSARFNRDHDRLAHQCWDGVSEVLAWARPTHDMRGAGHPTLVKHQMTGPNGQVGYALGEDGFEWFLDGKRIGNNPDADTIAKVEAELDFLHGQGANGSMRAVFAARSASGSDLLVEAFWLRQAHTADPEVSGVSVSDFYASDSTPNLGLIRVVADPGRRLRLDPQTPGYRMSHDEIIALLPQGQSPRDTVPF